MSGPPGAERRDARTARVIPLEPRARAQDGRRGRPAWGTLYAVVAVIAVVGAVAVIPLSPGAPRDAGSAAVAAAEFLTIATWLRVNRAARARSAGPPSGDDHEVADAEALRTRRVQWRDDVRARKAECDERAACRSGAVRRRSDG